MIDMKNRATAAKLPPIDDDMSENTAVRLAGSSTTRRRRRRRMLILVPSCSRSGPQAERARSASRPSPPRKTSAPWKKGGGDSMLARYFRDMAAHQVMGPDEELQTAKAVEQAEVDHWVALLSFVPDRRSHPRRRRRRDSPGQRSRDQRPADPRHAPAAQEPQEAAHQAHRRARARAGPTLSRGSGPVHPPARQRSPVDGARQPHRPRRRARARPRGRRDRRRARSSPIDAGVPPLHRQGRVDATSASTTRRTAS